MDGAFDEKKYQRWMESWKEASATGKLSTGQVCQAFKGLSNLTQIILVHLWRVWHESQNTTYKHESCDAVSVEGETLTHALGEYLFVREPTQDDVRAVADAAEELEKAGLVIQRNPGRWDIHAGTSFSAEALAENEEMRARQREEWGKRPRGHLVRLPGPKKHDN